MVLNPFASSFLLNKDDGYRFILHIQRCKKYQGVSAAWRDHVIPWKYNTLYIRDPSTLTRLWWKISCNALVGASVRRIILARGFFNILRESVFDNDADDDDVFSSIEEDAASEYTETDIGTLSSQAI